jgi:hypothetical protein
MVTYGLPGTSNKHLINSLSGSNTWIPDTKTEDAFIVGDMIEYGGTEMTSSRTFGTHTCLTETALVDT